MAEQASSPAALQQHAGAVVQNKPLPHPGKVAQREQEQNEDEDEDEGGGDGQRYYNPRTPEKQGARGARPRRISTVHEEEVE